MFSLSVHIWGGEGGYSFFSFRIEIVLYIYIYIDIYIYIYTWGCFQFFDYLVGLYWFDSPRNIMGGEPQRVFAGTASVEKEEAPAAGAAEPRCGQNQKALEKKLKQVAELEERREQGQALNADQLAKIAAKSAMVRDPIGAPL